MTRSNITIAILAVLILVLCVLCYVGKPLITGQYVPAMGTLVRNIEQTHTGQKIFKHYSKRMEKFVEFGALPPEVLTGQNEEKKDAFLVPGLGARLKALREKSGLSREEVAARMGLVGSGRQSTVSGSSVVVVADKTDRSPETHR